jgi:hypothetical protein
MSQTDALTRSLAKRRLAGRTIGLTLTFVHQEVRYASSYVVAARENELRLLLAVHVE